MSIVMCEKEKCKSFAVDGWFVLSIGEITYPETNSRAITQQESLWGMCGRTDSKLFEVS